MSPDEQRQLRSTRASRLPVVLVLVALMLTLIVPRSMQQRVSDLRREAGLAQSASVSVMRVQLALATETAASRMSFLSHDSLLAHEVATSRERRHRTEGQLRVASNQLTSNRGDSLVRDAIRLVGMNARFDSLTNRFRMPGQDIHLTEEQHLLSDTIIAFGDSLAAGFQSLAQQDRAAADRAESNISIVTAALIALGIAAALLVERLGQRFRMLALKLDENEARFRQIVENLTDAVWLAEPGLRRHLFVNEAYERIWGRPREALIARPQAFIESVHPEDQPAVLTALVDIEKGDTEIEFRIVRPDGAIRWVVSRSFPVSDRNGRVFRVGGILEDITEKRQHSMERDRLLAAERTARAEAESRKAQLERVTESRGRLVRGFTHDVKNPLGVADGFLALIEEESYGRLSAAYCNMIGKVRGAIRNALELIHQVLDVTRAEAGELEVEQRDTDVAGLVADVADAYRPAAEARHLAVDLEVDGELPHAYTDAKRVRQIVANLVSNAVKYTNPGGRIKVHVDAPMTRVENELRIAVADDGPGISPEKLPELFKEFTRLDPHAAEGAGIGLAFSQKIAQALGGEITVHSGNRPGTTFVLHLPVDARIRPRDAGSSPPISRT